MFHIQGQKQAIKTLLKKAQMMDIVDKHFKSAISDVVKEVWKNTKIMYYQIENINIDWSYKKGSMEVLKLKCTMIVMNKKNLKRLNNKFEQEEN